MSARRSVLAQGNLAVALAAAAALFVVVNLAAAKFWTQWDWTRAGLYSLSEQTRQVVGKVDRDVRIVSFLVERGQVSFDVLQQIRSVLSSYEGLNPRRVNVEFIDAQRDPLRARALLTEFNIDPLRDSIDIVVVKAGPRSKEIRLDDMVEFDAAAGVAGPPAVRRFKIESALTAAFMAVTRERKLTVRFATGHGERSSQSTDDAGLSRLVEALTRQDIQVGDWPALGAREVPAGTDLIVVAGPTSPWLPTERDALAKYLEQGGRAFILLDPVLRPGGGALADTGLTPLLAAWGVDAHDDIVIDPGRGLPFFGLETFYADTLGLHPVTSSLGGQPILCVLARSLAARAPAPGGVVVSSLAETTADGWGETDFTNLENVSKSEADRKGPLSLAMAAERKSEPEGGKPAAQGGRLVVTGDADLITNRVLDQIADRSFALNAISWLLQEERALGIQPKDRSLAKLFLSQRQMTSLFFLLVLVLPAGAVAAGLGVWLRRRQRHPGRRGPATPGAPRPTP